MAATPVRVPAVKASLISVSGSAFSHFPGFHPGGFRRRFGLLTGLCIPSVRLLDAGPLRRHVTGPIPPVPPGAGRLPLPAAGRVPLVAGPAPPAGPASGWLPRLAALPAPLVRPVSFSSAWRVSAMAFIASGHCSANSSGSGSNAWACAKASRIVAASCVATPLTRWRIAYTRAASAATRAASARAWAAFSSSFRRSSALIAASMGSSITRNSAVMRFASASMIRHRSKAGALISARVFSSATR